MTYFLWDVGVSKLLGAYRTEPEALSLVRALVAQYGDDYAQDLALGIERDDGTAEEPLSGAALLNRTAEVLAREAPAARR